MIADLSWSVSKAIAVTIFGFRMALDFGTLCAGDLAWLVQVVSGGLSPGF